MPVMAVKPDGTKLFVAWYDRRDDTANSLIHVYGRWATINADGSVTFGTEFRITTASFPPVFAGTRPSPYTNPGYYDPVYPPGGVNLTWWYPEWPLTNQFGEPFRTDPTYRSHVGEYNGACADGIYVYVSWGDNRLTAQGTRQPPTPRNQGDIRFSRIPWPQ
jgi:hypothetical protein